MSYDFDKAVQDLQDGKIKYLEFVLLSGRAKEYGDWCTRHSAPQNDTTAEFFVCQTFAEGMDAQDFTPDSDLYL